MEKTTNTKSNLQRKELSNTEKLILNSKYAKKLNYNASQNKILAYQIGKYIEENGFLLPSNKKSYDNRKFEILTDLETGEYFEHFDFLYKAYYELKKANKAVYALFQDPTTGQKKQQILTCWYSHHKLDHIWNMRKSQMIRKTWINYLFENRFLIDDYTPMHLVLTLPHKDGKFMGERFYLKHLIMRFNQMRKDDLFKDYFYGGEYGSEVTEGKNGLHIHLHCLLFQSKKHKTKEVRQYIKERWEELTTASIIHYSTLHINRKNESGQWIIEDIPEQSFKELDSNGNEQDIILREAGKRRKRFYLSESEDWYNDLNAQQKIEAYSSGILEAIKYHFKDASYKLENGEYDIQLIHEILVKTHCLRLYSKIGKFHGVKELNYTNPKEAAKPLIEVKQLDVSEYEQTDYELLQYLDENLTEDESEDLQASSIEAINNLINPFTVEPAKRNDYDIVISLPEKQKFFYKPEKNEVFQTVTSNENYFKVDKDIGIKKIMECLIKNQYSAIFRDIKETQRFYEYLDQFNKKMAF